jgi:diguanylate cyclase (GGDEF)-like protein/PAS domain S-box-containing protein
MTTQGLESSSRLRANLVGARRLPTLRLSREAPFAGTIVLALAAVASASAVTSPALVIGGLALGVGVTLAAMATPVNRTPAWADVAAALIFMLALGAIRVGAGGPGSGQAPLLLIPLLWLAVVGTDRRAAIGFVAMTLILVVPTVSAGPPDVADQLRRIAILMLASGLSVLAIRRLVEEARRASREVEDKARRLAEQVTLTKAVLGNADDMIVSFDEDGRIAAVNNSVVKGLGWSAEELVGRPLIDTIMPAAARDWARTSLKFVEMGETPAGRNAYLETEFRRADGALVPVEISAAVTIEHGGIVTHAFARDISSRRKLEETTRSHLRDLARLLSVARDLGRPSATTDGRDAICEAARELSGADLALFFEADPERELLVATGIAGDRHAPKQITLDNRRSLTAMVFTSPVPEFVGDMDVDDRVDHVVSARMGMRAAFFQPVVSDGQPIGVLVVYWREPMASVSERIRSLLELFATQASGVVERADLMSRLEFLARTDSLTGLANRRSLEESLIGELARAERSGLALSVVMLDLDHFKAYNDEHGHQAGDHLLRELAVAWGRELRPADTLARFGGEEFLAVLPGTGIVAARAVADRLRGSMPSGSTTSAGVATWEWHETMVDLVARADAALYEAKRLGRDRVEVARSSEIDPAPGHTKVPPAARRRAQVQTGR